MEGISFLRALGALLVVFGLLAAFTVLLRRYGHKLTGLTLASSGGQSARLAVVESKLIDARSKLVLVRRDKTEHLLLISATGATIVETQIEANKIA
jgi:flagellar protein FliO/FliZ